ncbi:hypothetical protein BaRGS_00015462 [Batillaria attramentaria]|uniref:Fibronectin type-III domain-containing protein n=1 Tax=Batillaria attramentaria TaxID=370345 RepID=A0ABD0L1X4_9CAEN
MNVARKSTTKLPQNWARIRPKSDETDSGLGPADSSEFQDATKDNFQEVLFNLKALNGSSDILDSGASDLKDAQKVLKSVQKEDGNKNVASPSKQNGEKLEKECDILDQNDSIVKTSDQSVKNGNLKGLAQMTSAKGSQSGEDEEEDVVMLLSEDDKTETKESQESVAKGPPKEQQKGGSKEGSADAVPKDSNSTGVKKKHPLQIGAKVRNTVHSIVSKLVQSGNPDVNSLITKTKSEDSQDSISSTSGDIDRSPLPTHHGKGNLFDNLDFDLSDKDGRSEKTSFTKDEDGDQAVPQKNHKVPVKEEQDKARSQGSDAATGSAQKVENSSSQGCDLSELVTDSFENTESKVKDRKAVDELEATASDKVVCETKNADDVSEKVESAEKKGAGETEKTESVGEDASVTDKTGDTVDAIKDCAESGGDPKVKGDREGIDVVEKTEADESKFTADSVNNHADDSVEMVEKHLDEKSENSGIAPDDSGTQPQSVCESGDGKLDKLSSIQKVTNSDASVSSPVVDTGTAEPMDTSDKSDSTKNDNRGSPDSAGECGDSVKLTDSERKRQHEAGSESDDSQIPKRSRLDEVIGKLGERVCIPSEAEENDSYDYEDSFPGDSESVEKQSEEASEAASASEGEEDKTAVSKSTIIQMTSKELEAMVRSKVKAHMAQQQVAELRTLRLRVVELQQAQDEWRQKAKDLERQVLDLTVLQQRLEKRKAHTAALRSITTRNFGVQVNEDKLRSNTPQKNTAPKTPPVPAGGASVGPVTPPAMGIPSVAWPTSPQPFGQPLVAPSSLSTVPSSTKVTTITIGGPLGSRNTSVAQLLSQTARMPTAASSVSTTNSRPALGRPPVPGMKAQAPTATQPPGSSAPKAIPAATAPPASSLVLVNAQTGMSVVSKGLAATAVSGPAILTTAPGTTNVPSTIKFIDLTTEDDPGASKQYGKPMAPSAGQVRGMVPQQVVRQISPMSQGVPGSTSTILLSSAAGTQIVGTQNLPRPPGMYQVVTIPNTQQLRPGSLVTVVPGQPGLVRPGAATSVSTVQVPPGMTIVRPALGVGAPVRPGSQAVASPARMPVTVSTLPPAAAPVQQDSSTSTTVSRAPKSVHPAPPPPAVSRNVPGETKPVPPRPGLKISRVKQGIVLSWNMTLPSDCIEIASYQLYAYQETSASPQTSLWKKVGDVKALPLPMACTLTQFQDGNKYHFAVRAVDIHGRTGSFSEPAFIFLSKNSSS